MKQEKKKKSKTRKIIEWVLIGIIGCIFGFVLVGQIQGFVTRNENYGQSLPYGYGNFVVKTDSMEPFYPVGSAIVTHKDNVDDLYHLYLEQTKYNDELNRDDGENLDQKMADTLTEIKGYLTTLSISTFDDETLTAKEKEIASYEDAQKKTEHLETIKKLKSAREKYYEIEDKYQHIDITFFDNYLGSYLDAKEIRALDDADGKSRFTSRTSPSQMIMTHRLRYIAKDEQAKEGEAKYIFYVSGTNYSTHYSQSGQYQVFSEKEFLGQVKINSPFLGGFFSFVSSVWGLLILIMIPALYLIITSGRDLIKSLKEKEEQEEAYAQYGISSTSLEGISKEDQERLKAEMLEEILYGKKDETKQEVVPETKEENPALEGISKEDQERLKAEMLAEMLNEKK